MPLRVLLADDHAIVRQGLRVLLEREGFEVIGEAGDGLSAVRLARERAPDVAVLDLVMPVLNGLDAAREIQHAAPGTKTVLLTMSQDEAQILSALQAGVRGVVLKTHEGGDLVRAIREVARGGICLSAGVSRALVEAYRSGRPLPPDPLTPRERQVLQLIAEGKRAKEIADLLCISVKTAESHKARISRKLGVGETAGLVKYAIQKGLTPL